MKKLMATKYDDNDSRKEKNTMKMTVEMNREKLMVKKWTIDIWARERLVISTLPQRVTIARERLIIFPVLNSMCL